MTSIANQSEEQHSLDWYRARLGKITGSRVGELMGKGKDTYFTQSATAYLEKVAAECMLPQEVVGDDDLLSVYLDEVSFSSRAMRIGSEREEDARQLYMELTGREVIEVGSIPHPGIQGFASSPDGVILDSDGNVEGCLEIKCPTPWTYLKYKSSIFEQFDLKRIKTEYYWQCISHMIVTGARWCDFMAYCPFNTSPYLLVRVQWSDGFAQALENRIRTSIEYMSNIILKATDNGNGNGKAVIRHY